MKLRATFCMLLLGNLSWAQDNRVPQEEATRYATLCVEQTKLGDAQIDMNVDPARACAERGEGGGAMIIPDRKLTNKAAQKAGSDTLPIGQLWLRKWTLVHKDRAVPSSQLRVLTLRIDDKDRPMPLLLLGLRKTKDDAAQLLVYGNANEPLQTLPLKSVAFEQELPVLLEWQRGEGNIDTLTIRILGKYETAVRVTRQ